MNLPTPVIRYQVIRCEAEELQTALNERTEGWKVVQVIYLYPRHHAYDIVLENPTYWLQRNLPVEEETDG